MPQLEASPTIDFQTETYKDAYSRINAIVIEGEQEAHDNYLTLAELLADKKAELIGLSKMENRHMKGFQACGRNLKVTPGHGICQTVLFGFAQKLPNGRG